MTVRMSFQLDNGCSVVGVAGPAGEGDDFADVLHARGQQYEALKAQAKAGVRHAAVAAQVKISGIRLQRHPLLPQPCLQHLTTGEATQGQGTHERALKGCEHGCSSMPWSFSCASDGESSR